jgi:hypothetical protein
LNSVLIIISNKCSMFVNISYIFIFFGFYRFSWGFSLSFIAYPSPFWFCRFWKGYFVIVSDVIYFFLKNLKKTLHEETSLFYILISLCYRLINKSSFAHKCWTSFSNWLKLPLLNVITEIPVYSGYSENYSSWIISAQNEKLCENAKYVVHAEELFFMYPF